MGSIRRKIGDGPAPLPDDPRPTLAALCSVADAMQSSNAAIRVPPASSVAWRMEGPMVLLTAESAASYSALSVMYLLEV